MNYKDAQRQAHQEANISGNPVAVVVAQRLASDDYDYETMTAHEAQIKRLDFRYLANPRTVIYGEYVAEAKAAGEAVMSLKEWKRDGSLSLADWKAKHSITGTERAQAKSKATNPGSSKKSGKNPSAPASRPNSGVTKRVWDIADKLTEGNAGGRSDRADIISACIEAGINPATAATQYSKWRKARSA